MITELIFTFSKIRKGKYHYVYGTHDYEIKNHGYYQPDHCIWWEAVNIKTQEADFHEKTLKQLLKTMNKELRNIN